MKDFLKEFFFDKSINNNNWTCAEFMFFELFLLFVLWYGITHS